MIKLKNVEVLDILAKILIYFKSLSMIIFKKKIFNNCKRFSILLNYIIALENATLRRNYHI